ncbi:3-coathanger stack domain-containing protein [Flavobacterium arsenatis]|uniref:3-coathanger stack domain-containing protein n=1 Tax=Flavobacterium arsenatis TaxID=1484332 RepID=UPI0035B540D1
MQYHNSSKHNRTYYHAGNAVLLNPGFTAEAGSFFMQIFLDVFIRLNKCRNQQTKLR